MLYSSTARLVCLALLLFGSGRARAVEPTTSCDDDVECKALYDQGIENFDASRYSEAEQSFALAYARRADPNLLYNLARAIHKAGKPAESVRYYQGFLDAGAAVDPEQRRKAENYLAQAQKAATPPPVAPLFVPLPPAQILPPLSQISHPPAPASPPPVPLYRKPWLWAILGVAVVGGAVGLGVGLAVRRPDLSNTMAAYPFSD